MEIVGTDGSRLRIEPCQSREFGRGNGLNSNDKTVSRRQISLYIPQFTDGQEGRLQFEVLGRNPIFVSRNNEVKIFRRFERGEMKDGDMFCFSAKNPIWHTLRASESCRQSSQRNDLETQLDELKSVDDLHQGDVDASAINPVTEFGFLVIGHEFDLYPKKMIRDIKDWDWFLEEAGRDSEDESDEENKGKRSGRKKRKKGMENDDEEWTGESEDDKALINKPRNAQKPKYTTRSKDHGKYSKHKSNSTKVTRSQDVDEVEDEDDETLGGFIVDDENLEEGDEVSDENEEELTDESDEEDE